MKDHCRLYIRRYSLSRRTINECNMLSADCVNASSIDVLNKLFFYNYLRRVGYTVYLTHRLKLVGLSISQ